MLYLITEEVLWAEGAGSVCRNGGLVSVVATPCSLEFTLPAGHCHGGNRVFLIHIKGGLFLCEAVAFDFTEVEDAIVDCYEVGV